MNQSKGPSKEPEQGTGTMSWNKELDKRLKERAGARSEELE